MKSIILSLVVMISGANASPLSDSVDQADHRLICSWNGIGYAPYNKDGKMFGPGFKNGNDCLSAIQ